MGSLDDLPEQNPVGPIEDQAEATFEAELRRTGLFERQQKDRHDYGSDYQLEVVEGNQRTNLRVHVQLKGTTESQNPDGSISVAVARRNLNYLLVPASSLYVCWHQPSDRLLAKSVEEVYADYEKSGRPWMQQETVTVRFADSFDEAYQSRWHRIALARGRDARAGRLEWTRTPPERLATAIRRALPHIIVPSSPGDALALLRQLYQQGHDVHVSHTFDQFHAVLGDDPNAVDLLYMAEINLGLNDHDFDPDRVRMSIDYFGNRGSILPGLTPASISYCLGNAHLALHSHDDAVRHFDEAIGLLAPADRTLGAMCWRNLGSAREALGRSEDARTAFERALSLDPEQPEGHLALGLWHIRHSRDLRRAIDHLDRVATNSRSAISMRTVNAWRASALFQLRRSEEAFAAVLAVVSSDPLDDWEWLWCGRLVHEFGTRDINSTVSALKFWRRFIGVHSTDGRGMADEFRCAWLLHADGQPTGIDLPRFTAMGIQLLAHDTADPALVWDRIGHWAQTDHDWIEAEAAFRRAFQLNPPRYAYCLGTALNFLDRWREALEVLLPTTATNGTDAMFWFQIGVAREHLADVSGAVDAYHRAIDLDKDYAVAHFNLGGVLWNGGEQLVAAGVWREAIRRFPDHELTTRLRRDLSILFE